MVHNSLPIEMKNDYKQKVPLGGELGKELERIWEAIRQNQVQPSSKVRVTRTPNGTTIKLNNRDEE